MCCMTTVKIFDYAPISLGPDDLEMWVEKGITSYATLFLLSPLGLENSSFQDMKKYHLHDNSSSSEENSYGKKYSQGNYI